MHKHSGFTLLELMFVLIVAGILVAVAVPALRNIFASAQLATQANEFVTAITLARSEAVRRSVPTFVTPLNAGDAANEWGPGWQVWADANDNGAQDANELLRQFEPMPAGMTLDSTNNVAQLEFRPTGFLSGVADTLQLRKTGCVRDQARDIDLSATGRPNVSRVACP
jgi:type IV fimbrial biogenesis protein FimT